MLLDMNSFDNMGTSGGTILLTDFDASRSSTATNVQVSTTRARTGAASLRMAAPTRLTSKALGASGGTFVFGAAVFFDSLAFGSGADGNGYLMDITEEDETIHL